MKKGENKSKLANNCSGRKADKNCKDCKCGPKCDCAKTGKVKRDRGMLDLRIILTTMVCVLTAILVVLILFYAGFCTGARDGKVSILGGADVSVLSVGYDYEDYSYTANPAQADKGSAILDSLSSVKKGKNYAVIESGDQLNQLYEELSNRTPDVVRGHNADTFFNHGVVIAVAVERGDIVDSELSSVTRDGDYDLYINMKGQKKDAADVKTTEDIPSKIYLIEVDNINPNHVQINENYE